MYRIIKNQSLQAFSIMETIVGMAVSAIVMGLIFVIFEIVTERMLDYKNQNLSVTDMNRLTYLINKDIFKSQQMKISEEGMAFSGYEGEKITYAFNQDLILRNTTVFTDTFRIHLNKISLDSLVSQSGKKVFKKINMDVKVNEKDFTLLFYKQIYPNELLLHLQ